MININSLLPAVKAIIYNKYHEEATDIERLNALIKLDRIVIDVLSDALMEKLANDCNPFFVSNLFNWYATYAKCYEVFILTSKLAEVTYEERKTILELLQGLENIDNLEQILNRLMELPVIKRVEQGTDPKEAGVSPAKRIKSSKSNKTIFDMKHTAVK